MIELTEVTLNAPQPAALAKRWSALLGRSISPAESLRLPLDHGEILFAQGVEGAPAFIAAVKLKVVDPDEIQARARAAGVPMENDAQLIGGVRFQLIA